MLAQTIGDLELFIIGDGVTPDTRDVIAELAAQDRRVRFIDRPKHERRGEPYRHEVLSEQASGSVVAYLCDRDLWLPNHLEELVRTLDGADFAHTLRFWVDDQDQYWCTHRTDLDGSRSRSGSSAHRPYGSRGWCPCRSPGTRSTPTAGCPTAGGSRRWTPRPTATCGASSSTSRGSAWRTARCRRSCRSSGDHPGLPTAERLERSSSGGRRASPTRAAPTSCSEVLLALWQAWRVGEIRNGQLDARRGDLCLVAAATKARRRSLRGPKPLLRSETVRGETGQSRASSGSSHRQPWLSSSA